MRDVQILDGNVEFSILRDGLTQVGLARLKSLDWRRCDAYTLNLVLVNRYDLPAMWMRTKLGRKKITVLARASNDHPVRMHTAYSLLLGAIERCLCGKDPAKPSWD